MQHARTRQWTPPACPPSPPNGPQARSSRAAAPASGSSASDMAQPACFRRAGEEIDGVARTFADLALPHPQPPPTPLPVSSPGSGLSSALALSTSPPHSSHTVAPVNIPAQALSPPTPAPSPTPTERWSYAPLHGPGSDHSHDDELAAGAGDVKVAAALMDQFRGLSKDERFSFLASLVGELQLNEALVISSKISPRLKRDFLSDLPVELALHCVSFIDDARTLGRAMQVCKYWSDLLQDERLWREMFNRRLYRPTLSQTHVPHSPPSVVNATTTQSGPAGSTGGLPPSWQRKFTPQIRRPLQQAQSFRDRFRDAYLTESNWLNGGRLLTMHSSMGDSVVTSLVVNDEYIVIGMANSKIHVFDAATGHYRISLLGHDLGVWALVLVSPRPRTDRRPVYEKNEKNGRRAPDNSRRASFNGGEFTQGFSVPPFRSSSAAGNDRDRHQGDRPRGRATQRMRSSDVCGAAAGWGIKRTLVVSGGCDREVRVWDIVTGECVYSLRGHSSTIRCLKVLDGRPIAVSGSRDFTLRVWDIDRGRMLRVLEGHEQSVRCIEVAGNQVVSGSYDFTCRLWDIDTGECLQVFEGHYHQIYAVAFDGERVVSGSLDSTVRVWDAGTGNCLAILQGHTSLVGQLQLSGDRLITGGSDGRVIVFDLNDYSCIYRLCAHDNSVTCLQFDDRFIVSGGNDGRVKLWDVRTGTRIRELTRPCDAVWRVCFRDDKCAILCQRNGKTVLEVLGFRPQDEQAKAGFSRTPDW